LNCKFCHKPIQEHPVGRETDACVAQAMGWTGVCYAPEKYGWTGTPPEPQFAGEWPIPPHTAGRDAAMRVWETLPFPRDLWQFEDDEADVAAGGEWPPAWALGIKHPEHAWKLAICHAKLILAAKEGEDE
jgi:hypothetical protein